MFVYFFFFKQKTAYEMRISDWSSDVCSSDLGSIPAGAGEPSSAAGTPGSTRVHPRGCGGAQTYGLESHRIEGPSPRVRGSQRQPEPRLKDPGRSEESRVGKAWVSTCSSRWAL